MIPSDRRRFLAQASLVTLAPLAAMLRHGAHAAATTGASNNGRILVVIQMSGGNDGINTVVPYADEAYGKHRKELRLQTDRLLKLDDSVGLHPAMRGAVDLIEDGRLAIVQGVGYPNPNRSHDISMSIWQSARLDRSQHSSHGWLGRAMDHAHRPAAGDQQAKSPEMILLGDESPPLALISRKSTVVAMADLGDLKLDQPSRFFSASQTQQHDLMSFVRQTSNDAVATAHLLSDESLKKSGIDSNYPTTKLARRLQSISRLIKAGFRTPVYYSMQSGYDTHAAQLPSHWRLLRDFSGALKAFMDDLHDAGLSDRVTLLAFSEFGRRVGENASGGTDHGTAGPVFVAGQNVQAGLVGPMPSLTDLQDGDLKMSVDFRQLYATILQDWLRLDPQDSLTGRFDTLPLFDA